MPMLTMPTATRDERVAYLMDRAMELAADWVRRGLTTGEIDRKRWTESRSSRRKSRSSAPT
jgi:hypothetical protein